MLFLFVQLFFRLDCQVAFLICLKSVTIIIYILKKMIPARARHKTILLPVVALSQAGSRPPHPARGDFSLLSARLSPGQIM